MPRPKEVWEGELGHCLPQSPWRLPRTPSSVTACPQPTRRAGALGGGELRAEGEEMRQCRWVGPGVGVPNRPRHTQAGECPPGASFPCGFGVFRAVLWRTENRLPAVGRVKVRAPRLPRGWGEVERKPSLPWVGPGAAVGEVPGCVGVWEQERRVLRPPPPSGQRMGVGRGGWRRGPGPEQVLVVDRVRARE